MGRGFSAVPDVDEDDDVEEDEEDEPKNIFPMLIMTTYRFFLCICQGAAEWREKSK